MAFSIKYDESVLTLTDTSNGTATKNLTYQKPSRLVSGCNFLWYGSETGEVTDGSVLLLTFKVSERATGSTPITVVCSDTDNYDSSYNMVALAGINGTVAISA